MFKIYNRLYTDEIPDFMQKYLPGHDKDALEAFKHRWMYFEKEDEIAAALKIDKSTVKVWLRVWRSNMDSALRNAYESGDFSAENRFPAPQDNRGVDM